MKNATRPLAIAVSTALLAFAGIAGAQQAPSAQQPPPAQQPPSADIDVSDADLESYVEAQTKIVDIQRDYSERLQGAEGPDQANELQQQANAEMINAVEDAGLEVESFNAIARAVQNDRELQQRIDEML